MQMWLTKGMFGEKVKIIAEETNNVKSIIEKLFMWKADRENCKRYKIEKYDRIISGNNQIAIDFGDYCWFMLIDGNGAENVVKELAYK